MTIEHPELHIVDMHGANYWSAQSCLCGYRLYQARLTFSHVDSEDYYDKILCK